MESVRQRNIMPFEVSDFPDLIRLLQEHPEWRNQLRNLLLTEELLGLPAIVRELVEAQKNTAIQLQVLIEQVNRNEKRLEGVETRLEGVETRLDGVETRLDRVETRLDRVEMRLDRMDDHLGQLRGQALEHKYRDNAPAYFGRLLHRVRVVTKQQLADLLEDRLSAEQFQDALLIDLVVRGRPRSHPNLGEVWLAVEVSTVIDRSDVIRASRRSQLIQTAGTHTLAIVAGESAIDSARETANSHKVTLLEDGKVEFWESAINAIR